MAFNEKEKKFLLDLAYKAINYFFDTRKKLEVRPEEVPSESLGHDGACFVTLNKRHNKELRGCIGSLEAKRPLVIDVVENAVGAAFKDPRFYPLKKEELPNIRISISVLTKPVKLKVRDSDDLLSQLRPKKHGLIIKKGISKATFLPSVWHQIPEKEDFLVNLCAKAGLGPMEWKDTKNMDFLVYETEEFEE